MNAALCSLVLNVKHFADVSSQQLLMPLQKLHTRAVATLKPMDYSQQKLRAFREMDNAIASTASHIVRLSSDKNSNDSHNHPLRS